MRSKDSHNGNVLFLILIAVALFAALSYAVTISTRSSGGNASKESASVSAGRILGFETSMRTAITRLTTGNAVSIYDLKFNNDVYKKKDGSLIFTTMGTPTDPKLYVFHPEGGGVSPQVFTNIAVQCAACSAGTGLSGHVAMHWVNMPEIGTSTSDVAVRILGLTKQVCQALNESNGISFIPQFNSLPNSAFNSSTPPVLAYPTGAASTDDDAIKGKPSFCYLESGASGRYNYSFVVKAN